jgi:beta-lactamase superfamily II metal-dependent hydrolase
VRVILFDVEHGFCAFVKSPNGYTLLIDCGKAANFSPVEFIRQHELAGTPKFNNHDLTKLIVTHPHEDHIEDISRVIQSLPPAILQRWQYDWNTVKSPEAGAGSYECLDSFAVWQARYSFPVTTEPNWGMDFKVFGLSPARSKLLGGSNNSIVNNTSMVTILTFQGTQYTIKFLFGGDIEEAGWKALLQEQGFRNAVHGTRFFFPSHHGHSSGFSTDLFKAMGVCPFLNVVSVTSSDESHDDRYSRPEYSMGWWVNGEERKMVSTRCDGAICIDVDASGMPTVQARHLPPNLAQRPFSRIAAQARAVGR